MGAGARCESPLCIHLLAQVGCLQRLTSTDVGDQVSHALGLEQLGEEGREVRLDLHASCLDKGVDIVSLQAPEL